jgi:hypothetical protein
MSAHTQGPWIKDKYGHIRESNGSMVLITGVGWSGAETNEVRANRDLFYAAPDLLAALKQCLLIVDAHRRVSGGEGDIAAMNARAAIAKAEGKS